MAFEILLFSFERGDVQRVDASRLSEVLNRHGLPEGAGAHHVQLRDGLDIELSRTDPSAHPDHDELCVATRGISAGMFELVHDLLSTVGLTAVVPDADDAVLVGEPSRVEHLPDEYATKAVVCMSPESVANVVLPIYERWRSWAL